MRIEGPDHRPAGSWVSRALAVFLTFVAGLAGVRAAHGQDVVKLRQRMQCEYLTPYLGVLQVASIQHGSHSLIRFDPKDPSYYLEIVKLDRRQTLLFSGSRFRGLARWEKDTHRLTVLNDRGERIRQFSCPSPFALLGDVGHVAFPPGSNLALARPADLRLFDLKGTQTGRFVRRGFLVRQLTTTDRGDIAMFIRPRDGKTPNRFVWVSPQGVVKQDLLLKDCRGMWSLGYVAESQGQVAFTYFTGLKEGPVMTSRPSVLRIAKAKRVGDPVSVPARDGGRPVWLNDHRVALFSTREVAVWDVRSRQWTGSKLMFSGDTILPECVVAGGFVTTVVRKPGEKADRVETVDLKTGRRRNSVLLPDGVRVDPARKAFFQTPDGTILLTPRKLFVIK